MLREEGHTGPDAPPRGNRAATAAKQRKKSYVVPCATAFRDAVTALAERRRVNVGDLARSVLLMLPRETVATFPDPGEPASGDRETVVLKSGPNADKPWRRKPRLQVRLPDGFAIGEIRRALAVALTLDGGDVTLSVEAGTRPGAHEQLAEAEAEVARLAGLVELLSFDPLPEGVRTRADALFVLGFAPGVRPDSDAVRTRFRKLAAVHHPDSGLGRHERMTQLNDALRLLRNA